MISANEKLRDFLLKHPHYVHRFENGTIKELIDHYDTAKSELMRRIARLEDYGTGYTLEYRLDRLNQQLREVDIILKNATDNAVAQLSYNLNEFASLEKDYYENLLSNVFKPVNINITRIPFAQVNQIVGTQLGGALYSDRMYKHYGDNVFKMKTALTQSVIQGEDMAKAARRLLGIGRGIGGVIGNEIAKQSMVIARTEIQRVSNAVSKEIYDSNQDILKGVQATATLDDKTCIQCASIDGNIYYYAKNPPNFIYPLHPLCRCTFVPITKSWKELGINADEVSAGTRASFSGQVPDTLTYNDWLKQMNKSDPGFVKDILGPKRYGYWKPGKLKLKQMATTNKILTLDQLKKKIK